MTHGGCEEAAVETERRRVVDTESAERERRRLPETAAETSRRNAITHGGVVRWESMD
jgi:hypothetical protein